MLHYTRTGDTILVPDDICAHADLELAHHQMQLHRTCRIDLCAWKWVAYLTLIHHGHVVPPDTSPHDRALERGLAQPGSDSPTRTTEPEAEPDRAAHTSPAAHDHHLISTLPPKESNSPAPDPHGPGDSEHGIELSAGLTKSDTLPIDLPDSPPFREILDGLTRLARDLRDRGDGR